MILKGPGASTRPNVEVRPPPTSRKQHKCQSDHKFHRMILDFRWQPNLRILSINDMFNVEPEPVHQPQATCCNARVGHSTSKPHFIYVMAHDADPLTLTLVHVQHLSTMLTAPELGWAGPDCSPARTQLVLSSRRLWKCWPRQEHDWCQRALPVSN